MRVVCCRQSDVVVGEWKGNGGANSFKREGGGWQWLRRCWKIKRSNREGEGAQRREAAAAAAAAAAGPKMLVGGGCSTPPAPRPMTLTQSLMAQ